MSRLRAPPGADDDAGGTPPPLRARDGRQARVRRTRSSSPPGGRGHDALFRLVSHEREAVAALAADAVCACADNVPPGARSRIAAASAPGRWTSPPSRSAPPRPLRFSLRHVREPGGEKKPSRTSRGTAASYRAMACGVRGAASERPGSIETRRCERVFAQRRRRRRRRRDRRARDGAGLGAPSSPPRVRARVARRRHGRGPPRFETPRTTRRAARGVPTARASKPTDAYRTPDADASSAAFATGPIAAAGAAAATTLDWATRAHPRGRRAPARDPRWRGASSETRRTSTSATGTRAAPRRRRLRRRRLRLRLRVVVVSAPLRPCWARTSCTRTAWLGRRAPSASVWTRARRRADMQPAPEHRAGAAELPTRWRRTG